VFSSKKAEKQTNPDEINQKIKIKWLNKIKVFLLSSHSDKVNKMVAI
jgi:hypothetical protein